MELIFKFGKTMMLTSNQIYLGDCLDLMDQIDDHSVDMILCDLPYQISACDWDIMIPVDQLWVHYNRIIKDKGAIVLTATQPFTTTLISGNMKGFCYTWVWNKRFAGNFVQAKRQPLKDHEDVLVFSKNGKMPLYYPQMIMRDKPIKKGKNECYDNSTIPVVTSARDNGKLYDKKYPTTTSLNFNVREDRGLHPTQKPVSLFEYLIKTYTKEGDLVLDNCAGSGTTGVAALNTKRDFLLIEKDPEYYRLAKERIEKHETKRN